MAHSHLDMPILGSNGADYYDSYVSDQQLATSPQAFNGLGCMRPAGVSGDPSGAMPGMGGVFGMRQGARQYGMFGLGEGEGAAVVEDTTRKMAIYLGAIGLGILIGRYVIPKRK
jgi:hypothetical protein